MNVPLLLRWLLWPLSVLYGASTWLRTWLYAKGILKQKRLNRPVISVGNITVGGTGKTPMVIWLAERLLAEGKRVGILSRGYKGSGGTSDEIELMKSRLQGRALFGVGPNRYEQGQKLAANVDVFLLDDGFQHLQLARDVNILLLDGSKKLKQQWLLPAGELREPVREVGRADLIVITRKSERLAMEVQDSHTYKIFYAQTHLLGFRTSETPDRDKYLTEIGAGPFFAFCGIGNPQGFLQDLSRWKVPICGHALFRDHHRYSEADCRKLTEEAKTARAAGFVTTEKDWFNLSEIGPLPMPTYVAVITLSLRFESEFKACLDEKLMSGGMAS
jgi:tetraacyldisaccharide 4'-kinase